MREKNRFCRGNLDAQEVDRSVCRNGAAVGVVARARQVAEWYDRAGGNRGQETQSFVFEYVEAFLV